MLISKKRVRALGPNVRGVAEGQVVFVALQNPEAHLEALARCGFSPELGAGETVLPSSAGPVSRFNADGKYIILKDQPKETVSRQMEWTWTEFRGRYGREEVAKIVDVPYERFPRRFVPPPSEELTIAEGAAGPLVISREFRFHEGNVELLHVVNLFLELFGECTILDAELNEPISVPTRRLNWEVLPRGEMPWETLAPLIEPVLRREPDGNRAVIEARIKTITGHTPDFVAVGRAGFSGYLIFGFVSRSLYVLESTQTNNATYVLRNDWEALSALTKAEILNGDLHERRVIHREGWFNEMNDLLQRAQRGRSRAAAKQAHAF